jgi:hypothetical protein
MISLSRLFRIASILRDDRYSTTPASGALQMKPKNDKKITFRETFAFVLMAVTLASYLSAPAEKDSTSL